MEDEFPIEDCLNPNEYGLKVEFWKEKEKINDIDKGEEHYDFVSIIFYNCPAGALIFRKKLLATIAKTYIPEAIKLIKRR